MAFFYDCKDPPTSWYDILIGRSLYSGVSKLSIANNLPTFFLLKRAPIWHSKASDKNNKLRVGGRLWESALLADLFPFQFSPCLPSLNWLLPHPLARLATAASPSDLPGLFPCTLFESFLCLFIELKQDWHFSK